MPKATEQELLALKERYLTAHWEYDRCVEALALAGLRSATSLPDSSLDRLAKAFFELQAARNEYRAALFGAAFGTSESLN